MPIPISRQSGEHYVWGGVSEGWHLVRAAGLSVIEEHMPPAAREIPHHHQRARQFFYVLKGALLIELPGHTHRLQVGDGLEIEPGTVHQVKTDGSMGADFLVISQPPTAGDRHETAAV